MTDSHFDTGRAAERALRLHKDGKLAEAERLYLDVLAAEPANFTARHALGVIQAQQGRTMEAIEWIGSALEVDPLVAPAWLNYANILAGAGRLAEAAASYDRALAIQPGLLDALVNRAAVLGELGRLEEALSDYDRVLALNPGDVEALNNRGNVLRRLRHFDEALASYDRALALQPGLVETLINRGVALSELGRPDEAVASYDAALAIKPGSAPALNNRGFTLRTQGRIADALSDYDAALAIAPDYPDALNNRAKALLDLDRIAESFADFTRAAQVAYCAAPLPAAGDVPAHKLRHDEEQRSHLGADGAIARSQLAGGARLAGPAVNPARDVDRVFERWQTSTPKIVVIDDFLTAAALGELQHFCRDSTIWRTVYRDGYLGAFPEQGFACPLLGQIAGELRRAFPAIFAPHTLRYLWAFKYDSRLSGTAVHADEAAVNVNFWITPDDANLDPQSGGLVVWDTKPPPEWDFARFNGEPAPIRAFLEQSGAKAITVPYRANRAVIFDSDLFHQTDAIRFKDGYCNRRINITLLYGQRATTGS